MAPDHWKGGIKGVRRGCKGCQKGVLTPIPITEFRGGV